VLGRVVTFDAQRLAFGGFGFDGSPEPEDAVPFIAPEEVRADDLVVDLRGVDEAPQTFAGGRRIGVDHVAVLASEPSPRGRIVLCCRSGQRALLAADRLRERGLAKLALVALG
jgi:rhodanese-related sulfurtransferase